ncbi:MAG: hypothetical protein GWM89_03370 [Candidatus Dadabacteria bacterium]|nr:hypothetical protein [Candidatus Dadabacteria bacterium]NIY21467.1 hypothetical protein [Candidatus Dadabacteria bacterium]
MIVKYIFLVCLTLVVFVAGTSFSEAQYIWFNDIKEHKKLKQDDSLELSKTIYESVQNRHELNPDKIDLKKHDYPNIIFISASDSIKPAYIGLGSGISLLIAVNSALASLYKALPRNFDLKWLKIDIVKEAQSIDDFNFRKPVKIDQTLSGIAFNQASGIALIAQEIDSSKIINNGFIDKYVLANYLHKKEHRYNNYDAIDYWDNNKLFMFISESYFYDGNTGYRLSGGHRANLEIDTELLHKSARLAGRYFLNSIQPDGSFMFRNQPEADSSVNNYSILTHAASIYALLGLFENSGNDSILKQARLTIDYIKRFTKECTLGDTSSLCVIDEPEYLVKLVANGLASTAVAKYIKLSGDNSLLEYLNGVNSYILSSIKEDGGFYPHTVEFFTGNVRNVYSEYYPWEAILGLLMSCEITNDKKLLDAAIKASDYLINIKHKDKTLDDISHDHWLVYALSKLYVHKPDKLYLDHIFRISDSIVKAQQNSSNTKDLTLSFDNLPASTPAATISEALFTALNIARNTGEKKRADKYLYTLKKSVTFQLYNQYMPESAMYMSDPEQSLGSFKAGHHDLEIKNNYSHHNLSGILGLLKILEVNKF